MTLYETFIAKQKELIGRRRRSHDSNFNGTCVRQVDVALSGGGLANSHRYACRANFLDGGVHLFQRHIPAVTTVARYNMSCFTVQSYNFSVTK